MSQAYNVFLQGTVDPETGEVTLPTEQEKREWLRNATTVDCSQDEGRTKQEFKDECDINNIVARHDRGETVDHLRRFGEHYSDNTGVDFQDAMNLVTSTQQMFEALPAHVRAEMSNDPRVFLEFVQNPDNLARMRELGLAEQLDPSSPVTDPGPGPGPSPTDGVTEAPAEPRAS